MGSLTSKRMGGSGDDLPHQDESGCQKREGEPGWTLGWCLAGLFGRENDCEVHSTKIHQQITQALLGVYNQQISRLVNKSLTRAQVLEIKIPHKWRAPQLKGKWEIFWGGCCNTSIYWETCPSLQKRNVRNCYTWFLKFLAPGCLQHSTELFGCTSHFLTIPNHMSGISEDAR